MIENSCPKYNNNTITLLKSQNKKTFKARPFL